MKSAVKVLCGLALLGSLATGCAYAGVAAVDNNTVVIARNDAFLFGLLRGVYVCQVAETGLTGCGKGESP